MISVKNLNLYKEKKSKKEGISENNVLIKSIIFLTLN